MDEEKLLYKRENQVYSSSLPYHEMNITLPVTQHLLNNGSVYAHIFFGKSSILPSADRTCASSVGQTHTVYRNYKLNSVIV